MAPRRKVEKEKAEEAGFKKGDKVKARWTGSNVYYDGKVLELSAKTCKVQFDDGSTHSIKLSDVKAIKVEEEPRRSGRPRSRSGSVGRKPVTKSRSRSPARKVKEKKEAPVKPERKSVEKQVEKKAKKSEENSNSRSKDEPDYPLKSPFTGATISTYSEATISTLSATVARNNLSYKESYENAESSSNAVHVRTSSRLAALHALKAAEKLENRSSPAKQNATSKDDNKYSDDDEDDEEEFEILVSKPSGIIQALRVSATLLKIILIPGLLLFLLFACTRKQCTILEVPQFYATFVDCYKAVRWPFLHVAGFHIIQCLLSLLPLGRKVKGFPAASNEAPKEYRLNGFISLILCSSVLAACSYFGLNTNVVFDKFRSYGLSCAIYCILWAIGLHLMGLIKGDGARTSKVPVLGGFYDGFYFNPVVFKAIDVKTTFIRSGLIGLVILNSCILLKFYLQKGLLFTPLLLTALMQIFFVADMLFREEKLLSTATYTSDSVGYSFLLTTGFTVPISLSFLSVFNYIRDVKVVPATPYWCYGAMVCLFFCGYFIYLRSTNMKHNFRKNPYSPSLTDVNSIPTSRKKRLISSSLWGLVRHPNYFGLLIMAVAWTLPCGFTHLVPFGPLALLAVSMVVRCIRVENECQEKYGPAWQNYTTKVRSRIIPYVF